MLEGDLNALLDANVLPELPAPVPAGNGSLIDSAIGFVSSMGTEAFSLIQQNAKWLVVILALTWLVDNFALSKLPIPKGIIRLFFSFLVVMALAGVWVGFLQGFV